jgi:hypothetical protein
MKRKLAYRFVSAKGKGASPFALLLTDGKWR